MGFAVTAGLAGAGFAGAGFFVTGACFCPAGA
jgi:hypothetical protein